MTILSNWFRKTFADPQLVLLLVFLTATIVAVVLLSDMLAPAIVAIVLAFLLDGPAEWLRRRGMSNMAAAAITFVGFLILIVAAIVLLLPPLIDQIAVLAGALPSMVDELNVAAMNLPKQFPTIIDETQTEELLSRLRQEALTGAERLLNYSLTGLTGVVTGVVYSILVTMMLFFFLKDKKMILTWVGSFLPPHRPLIDQVLAEMVERSGDYVRGKVYEIIIVGLVSWATFAAIGLPFAGILGLITGFSVLIPYIGATVATFPVAFVAFVEWGFGPEFIGAVVAYLVLQALDGNLLAPLLFSEVVKLHPNAIIIAILFFGGIWGLWGVFFAIPLATLAHAVIKAWPRELPTADTTNPVANQI